MWHYRSGFVLGGEVHQPAELLQVVDDLYGEDGLLDQLLFNFTHRFIIHTHTAYLNYIHFATPSYYCTKYPTIHYSLPP